MGMFDVEDHVEQGMFEERYNSIAAKFKSMFDLPVPLLVEDHNIKLEKDLNFSPELVGMNIENILFYDLSKPINKEMLWTLLDPFFLGTIEGIIFSNIDKIDPENLPEAQELIKKILTEKDISDNATFKGNKSISLLISGKVEEKHREIYESSPEANGQPRVTRWIKVALICKEIPEYLKDKNIFCSKILMNENRKLI